MLNVHRKCVSLCRENAGLSLDKLHAIAENGLKEQLQQLGFDVSGDVCKTQTCILAVADLDRD